MPGVTQIQLDPAHPASSASVFEATDNVFQNTEHPAPSFYENTAYSDRMNSKAEQKPGSLSEKARQFLPAVARNLSIPCFVKTNSSI